MNTRQIHIFLIFFKVIWQFVWLFTCFVRFMNASLSLKLFCFDFCNKNNFLLALAFAHLTKRVNKHWKFWRKYRSASYKFSCTLKQFELWRKIFLVSLAKRLAHIQTCKNTLLMAGIWYMCYYKWRNQYYVRLTTEVIRIHQNSSPTNIWSIL